MPALPLAQADVMSGLLLTLAAWALSASPPGLSPKIDHHRFTLDNGLAVMVHVDRRSPLVAVSLDYRVGSSDEPPGRTGFAHLFEHLMFMGTAAVPRGHFDALMEAEGAWNNAWTSTDRTHYFEVGPSHALPLLLWLEADRMLGLGPAIDQQKLDVQREVVRNERRQNIEDAPYGLVYTALPALLYPPGDPYHHAPIGSHADLQAATVGDVQRFFARWYSPDNASLVVAGDVDPAEVERLVRRLFGPIPRGVGRPPRPDPRPPGRPAVRTRTEADEVDQARVIFAWQSPAHYRPGDAALDVLSTVLSDGKSSRLHQALVHGEAIARDVYAAQWSGRLGSQFVVWATGRDGIDVDRLQARLEAALASSIAAIDEDDVRRAGAGIVKAFVEGIESVQDRASTLNGYYSALGRADFVAEDLARYTAVDVDAVKAAASRFLTDERRGILRIVPRRSATRRGGEGGR